MFNRFTKDARHTVERAQLEALALGHDRIGTEHLLLGVALSPGRAGELLAEHGASADSLRATLRASAPPLDGDALASVGIDLDEVRRRVEASFGPGALERGRRGRTRRTPFTPRAKKALELALREAVALGDRHIGPEHLLLGLLRDDATGAAAVLRRAGAPIASLREALRPAGSRRGRGG
jgi:ATP-dependent Clp protease ATP-binding subunit ClpA